MQKVRPFLWFDDRAAEAAKFYASIFKNAEIVSPENLDALDASEVTSVTFRIDGQEYIAFNGGPHYTFSPAFSLFVDCDTQEEIDYYWERLTAGGEPIRCGWLNDKFGLTWQIVPSILIDLLGSDDEAEAKAVREAMMGMIKLDIAGLQNAAALSRSG
jgi:predicted 3-demethylubiquinone-9 3-methyltransferase (glyoxalase superfamily)